MKQVKFSLANKSNQNTVESWFSQLVLLSQHISQESNNNIVSVTFCVYICESVSLYNACLQTFSAS